MKTLYSLSELPQPFECVLTVGTYDGLHLGHQQLMKKVVTRAKERELPAVVLSFSPPPWKFFHPHRPLRHLLLPQERNLLLGSMGLDMLISLPFDHRMASMLARSFVKQVLLERLGTRHIVLGHDHRFGKDREGDVQLLKDYEDRMVVEPLSAYSCDKQVISTSLLRNLLSQGQVERVKKYLGRPYTLSGIVVRGEQRGRTLGFPTANLCVDVQKCLPKEGVYAIRVRKEEDVFEGMLYVGPKKVGKEVGEKKVEAHLFNFNSPHPLYDTKLHVFFFKYLRKSRTFEEWTALRAQLLQDKQAALAFFGAQRKDNEKGKEAGGSGKKVLRQGS